jgi:multidrug efflux pump subunit AcrA (membrane-fusion protein)
MNKASRYFALLAALTLVACGSPPTQRAELPQAVRVVQVRQGPVAAGYGYLADVVSARSVRVLAQVPGTVAALPAAEGDLARAADPLVRIAAPDLAARLQRVSSERARAQRERDFACAHTATDRLLAETGDVPPEALDASERGCASAELAVAAAVAAEAEVTAVVARSAEKAPFTGRVLDHLVDVGQTVMPGMPLVVFGSEERELLLHLPESDLDAGALPGASVVFDGGRAEVVRVGSWAKGPGRLVDVWATPVEGSLPRVGSVTSVRLITEVIDEASSVPLRALGTSTDGDFVLAVRGDTLERVQVTTGPQQDGWVSVEPRLPEGTRVVSGGVQGLDVERTVFPVEVER